MAWIETIAIMGNTTHRWNIDTVADTLAMYEIVLCETGVDPLEYA